MKEPLVPDAPKRVCTFWALYIRKPEPEAPELTATLPASIDVGTKSKTPDPSAFIVYQR
jgi:hypothetical protein